MTEDDRDPVGGRRPRRLVTLATIVGATAVLVGACAAPSTDTAPLVVGNEETGLATVDARGVASVPGVELATLYQGPLAVPIDGERVVVAARDTLALVAAGAPAKVVECVDCSGVAVTADEIITTRRDYTPGEGFEIVRFDHDLARVGSATAVRRTERGTEEFPAENTQSPITLAADDEGVIVGYLSRYGGARRGPSILARHDRDGRMVASTQVDGVLGRSAASSDGRFLAVGVGGSGGACITESNPTVLELATMRVTAPTPEVPAAVGTDSSTLSEPWFQLADLQWDDNVLVATGEVHAVGDAESCDDDPEPWRRLFDPTTSNTVDVRVDDLGERWLGPQCGDRMAVASRRPGAEPSPQAEAGVRSIGSSDRLGPGLTAPAECRGRS